MQTKIHLVFIKGISTPGTETLGEAPLSIFPVHRAAVYSVLDRKIHQVMDYSSSVFFLSFFFAGGKNNCSECQGMMYAK